ncbi:MAG TPA: serine/threonine-protein kinase [Kofleriaceae bacterium]
MATVLDLADAILHAALGADADRVWIDPVPLAEACYMVSVERRAKVISTATLDEETARGVIARFAMIAEVDMTSPKPSTGAAKVRRGDQAYEVVVMVRPGAQPRAEIMLQRDSRSKNEHYRNLTAGDIVDHYRVVERLGSGGMGRVYRVDHITLGRPYALKVLHSEVLQRDPRSIDRFVREARAASRIRHPNIIDVFDFGYLLDGRPYFVMELLEGESLGDVIDHGGPIEPERALSFVKQLSGALCAAHEAGVIHSDVTPSNILVTADHVKLVDFGLAELLESQIIDETATHVMGTPRYVAPERLLGRAATEACDQYALGIVMFEMIAGITPFHAPDLRALCKQHISEPVPELLSPFGPLPAELDRFISRCLAKSPAHRFPTMASFAAELDRVTWLVNQENRRVAS